MTLLAKGAAEIVPLDQSESGFYSHYFLVPKKDGSLRPILDLRHLNRALMKRPFRMTTLKQILSQICPGDWFFNPGPERRLLSHPDSPHHRRFLRFAFEGVAYQYMVLPFGLSLAPCNFMKCMDVALSPLRQMGVRILNYLDDWLVLAQSEAEQLSHRSLLLSHLECLGLRANFAKSSLSLSQQIMFLEAVFDWPCNSSRYPSKWEPLASSRCFKRCLASWPPHLQCCSWACFTWGPYSTGWNHKFCPMHGVTDAFESRWTRPA